ncbi:MAG: hypothetical protein NVSMB9_02440 [Isosphaeraceae bacterium]
MRTQGAPATLNPASVPLQIAVPGLEIRPGDTVIGCGEGSVRVHAGRVGDAGIGIVADEAAVGGGRDR